MTDPAVQIYVRDATRETIGLLAGWTRLTVVQRRNDVGRWTLTLPTPDEAILAPGTGIIIRRDGKTLCSGWRWPGYEVTATGQERSWVVSGWDDTVMLDDTLCWPTPTAAIGAQTDTDDTTGTAFASTRIRLFFLRNVVNRLAVPGADAGTDPGIGAVGQGRARFRNLLELAQEYAGTDVIFRVVQQDDDNALELVQRVPADLRLSAQFSPDVGTVHGWTYTDVGPTATRVIVGVGGEDTDRVFRLRTATDAGLVGSRESDWSNVRRIERFRDARDLDPAEGTTPDEADVRGDDELIVGRRGQTLRIDVSDVPGLRYGVDYEVGDLVRAYTEPGVTVDDYAEQVEVNWDAEEGERTQVWVGPVEEPEERDAKRERRLRKQIRQLETAR